VPADKNKIIESVSAEAVARAFRKMSGQAVDPKYIIVPETKGLALKDGEAVVDVKFELHPDVKFDAQLELNWNVAGA